MKRPNWNDTEFRGGDGQLLKMLFMEAQDYYDKVVIKCNAAHYNHHIVNSKNQDIEFYEHPLHGDEAPVIAVCHKLKMAANTNFYDLDDMYEGSNYLPVFLENGECVCEFELEPN